MNMLLAKCLRGAAALLAVAAPFAARAGTLTVLYTFTGGADGGEPAGGVVEDTAGTLFGTTFRGGIACADARAQRNGCGTVYAVTPAGLETTLVTFRGSNGASSANPLTLAGTTLYGSTQAGGASDDGVLFSVHTDGSRFSLLHQFSGADGSLPVDALHPGPRGTAYGITYAGGPANAGVLFKLGADGSFEILHGFAGGADGSQPSAILVTPSGTIFGSTLGGGEACSFNPAGCGLLFSYVPSTGAYAVLHDFVGTDGAEPTLGSISAQGTLYGTTYIGGADSGTLFAFAPVSRKLATLYNFTSNGNGFYPVSGPVLTPTGLVGVTRSGGASGGGALYSYSAGVMATLYDFGNPLTTGTFPEAQPIVSATGSILGTAAQSGMIPCTVTGKKDPVGCGTVYGFSP